MKKRTAWTRKTALLMVCILLLTGCQKTGVNNSPEKTAQVHKEVKTDKELYKDSIEDAMVAEKDEVKPVIAITKDSKDVIWKNSTNQVLMLTYNNSPESYPDGQDVKMKDGEIWVTSVEEMLNWYRKNKDGVDDWTLRFKQLIGLPEEDTYTHMTAVWVTPDDMFRPAYVNDITNTKMTCQFGKNVSADYKKWFDDNIIFSYYDSAYPWTRLGYTYDWADNGTARGLCEFIVNKDAKVHVEFTKTVDEFIKWMDSMGTDKEKDLGQE